MSDKRIAIDVTPYVDGARNYEQNIKNRQARLNEIRDKITKLEDEEMELSRGFDMCMPKWKCDLIDHIQKLAQEDIL